ncbi:hypothetical protein WE666_005403, partial [Escherichia coli O117:H42]
MAAEPLSGGGAVGLTIGGASIFGILTNTDFGVVIGAFAGALFVVTQQKEVPVWRMCIHLLVAVVRRALELTEVDFGITEGLRSKYRQKQLVAEGKSQTMNSRHLT